MAFEPYKFPRAPISKTEWNALLEEIGAGATVTWSTLSGKPTTFDPSPHTHVIADVTGLQSALDGKQVAGSYALTSHDHSGVYAPVTHSHVIADVTGLQAALDGKQAAGSYQPLSTVLTNTTASFTTAQETKLSGIAVGATANDTDINLKARANHTGTQSLDTTTDSAARLAMTSAERTKLTGIATGATANATDAQLRDRSTHTGTQAVGTITGLATVATSGSAADLSGTLAAARLPAFSGDATSTAGTAALTLGTVNSNVGTFGSSTLVPVVTVNAKGLVTAVSTVAVSGGGGGSSDPLVLVSSDGSATAADTVKVFRMPLANRQFPAFVGPSGQDTALQSALHGNAIFFVSPTSGTTAPSCIGGTLTTATTMSLPALASTNLWTSIQRKRFQTAATAGSATGMRTAYAQWWRGNSQGRGGFFYRSRFGQQLNVNGAQCFHGLCASTAALATTAGAVAALVNMVGVGFDTTDASTGNWFLYRNDGTGTATKTDLGTGAARNTTDGYELLLFCPPHGASAPSNIWAEVRNLNTGATVLAATELTTDLPANTAFMAFKSECNNGAVASAVNIEVAQVYVESDF